MRSSRRARAIVAAVVSLTTFGAGLVLAGPAVAAPVADPAGLSVTGFSQAYQDKQGGRIAVTLTFDEAIDAHSLPQGWNGSGTTFTKVFYSSGPVSVSFADLAGEHGSYSFVVDRTAPAVTGVDEEWQDKQGGRIAVTFSFSEAIAPSSLPQGWYGSGTSFTKVFYGSRTTEVDFTDLVGNPGSTQLHVLDVPTGIAPAGLIATTGDPASWNPVVGAATYQTRIAPTVDGLATAAANGPFACAAVAGRCTLAGYPVPEGSWAWQVRALAAGGTVGPWSPAVALTVDRTAPTAVVTYSTTAPTAGNIFAYLAPSEPVTMISTGWETRPDGTFRKSYPKNDKSPNWDQTVQFRDAAGNVGSAHVLIDWIDIVPPTAPTPLGPLGWTLASDRFTWSASTDANGPVRYEVTLGDHPNVDAAGRMTTNAVTYPATANSLDLTLPTGPEFWQVRAIDALGNASAWSAPQGVQVIGVPAITSPTEHQIVGRDVTVTWSGVFGIGGVQGYQLKWNGPDGLAHTQFAAGDVRTTVLDLGTQEGNSTIRVRAEYAIPFSPADPASVWGPWSGNVHVTHDATRPTVTVDAPAPGLVTKDAAAFPVTVTASDANGVAKVAANLYDASGKLLKALGQASGAALGSSTTQTWSVPAGLAEGVYTIRAGANDSVGNNGTVEASFTVDLTKPTVGIESPAAGAPRNGDVTVTVAGSDAVGVGRLAANLYDESGDFVGPIGSTPADTALGGTAARSWTIPAGAHPDGTYTIRASAADLAGNVRATSVVLVLDATAPARVRLSSAGNGAVVTSHDFTLRWQPVADASGVTYELESSTDDALAPDGSLASHLGGGSASLTLPQLPLSGVPDATYFWHVRAVDGAGNAGPWSDLWKVTVDTTPAAAAVPGDSTNAAPSVVARPSAARSGGTVPAASDPATDLQLETHALPVADTGADTGATADQHPVVDAEPTTASDVSPFAGSWWIVAGLAALAVLALGFLLWRMRVTVLRGR